MTTTPTPAQIFRELLQKPEILVLPGVYDCLSAKIAEKVGFPAVFSSGFGIAGSTLGLPDYGFLTATEVIYSVGRIASALTIPLVADLDTGYGNPLTVMRFVKEVTKLGIAGVILEDQVFPKKCGHFSGKQVISCEDHVQKIKSAVETRESDDLIIIARTDARAVLGLEEAIYRGEAYMNAGADVLFIEAPQSVLELEKIARHFQGVPLFANMIEGGKTPCLTQKELQDMGYKIVVYPLSGLFSATKALLDCMTHLKEQGTTIGYNYLVNFSEFETFIDVPKYQELEKKFTVDQDQKPIL